jgi:hypothetical protein
MYKDIEETADLSLAMPSKENIISSLCGKFVLVC